LKTRGVGTLDDDMKNLFLGNLTKDKDWDKPRSLWL